ncbi:hypothetical protein [Deinococcus saxicola]|uniref:hypothetical protein n=1 Tax=Deinococcus saxicola TaxID=249406 RepID=UPI0039EF1FA6
MPENTSPDAVAAAARAALAARGLSARGLARRLGMNKRTITDFLFERRETRTSTRLSICRELGIDQESSEGVAA